MSSGEETQPNNGNGKPTYAQVAAAPPQHAEDEGGNEPEKERERTESQTEGALISKPKKAEVGEGEGQKTKAKSGSTGSSTGSEPEIINLEPSPSVDGNKIRPKPVNVIPDNVVEEIRLVRTTMLTEEEKHKMKEKESDSGIEVLSEESENRRRQRQKAIIVTSSVVAGLAIFGAIFWGVCRGSSRSD